VKFDSADGYGQYEGKISIYGSGGSNKVFGNFAPTTKCSKNDAQINVGIGQCTTKPVNQKLANLAMNKAVLAVFLNESYYRKQSSVQNDFSGSLRFLGYYHFFETCYVAGDEHQDVSKEFNFPSD
jgi:hypothetical protein